MSDKRTLNEESSAVQTHLEIVQGVISRMAGNSRSCKVWCVTLVAAVLVLVARTGEPQHALIAVVPTALFLILDTYYLALERAFIGSYNGFVKKLHDGSLAVTDIYKIAPTGSIPKLFFDCLRSFSIWPFYPVVLATILLAWWLIIPSTTNGGM